MLLLFYTTTEGQEKYQMISLASLQYVIFMTKAFYPPNTPPATKTMQDLAIVGGSPSLRNSPRHGLISITGASCAITKARNWCKDLVSQVASFEPYPWLFNAVRRNNGCSTDQCSFFADSVNQQSLQVWSIKSFVFWIEAQLGSS